MNVIILPKKIFSFLSVGVFFLIAVLFVYYTSDNRIYFHYFSNSFSVYDKSTKVLLKGNITKAKGKKRGNILFLHGSTKFGRRLPFYRILQKKLAENGFDVAVFDFRTHGDSDSPSEGTFENLDRRRDISLILNYLKWDSVHIIGHSMGGSLGMRAISDKIIENVKSIVSIGPARRVKELFLRKESYEKFTRAKNVLQTRINSPEEISDDVVKEIFNNLDINNTIDYYSTSGHVPIFLIDGENENKEDHEFLRNYFNEIVDDKMYFTIPDADHYCNTSGLFFKYSKNRLSDYEFVLYNKKIINNLIKNIVCWLDKYNL